MTHIKKYCFTLLAGLLLCAASVAAFAAEPAGFVLTESKDYAEISQLSDKICEWVNGAMEEQGDTSAPITPKDLDFSHAYRNDLSTNIFHENIATEAELLNYLEQHNDYTWNIPVFTRGMTYEVTLSIGQPVNPDADLTEEERLKIAAEEGKWSVDSVGVAEGHIVDDITAIQDALEQSGQPYDRIYIFGNESGMRTVIAILSYQDKLVSVAPIYYDIDITDQRTESSSIQRNARKANNTSEITFQADTVYSFYEMKDIISQTSIVEDNDEVGGSDLVIKAPSSPEKQPITGYITAAVLVVLAALGAGVWYKRRKA